MPDLIDPSAVLAPDGVNSDVADVDPLASLLSRVRVVLTATSHPGNIGATARAMKNMGLTRLVLVTPKTFPSEEATARAAGAVDVLESAEVVETLDEALVGCRRVYGSSARPRRIGGEIVTPREAAGGCRQILEQWGDAEVAIVFGRERSGLTNDELDRCTSLLRIPTNPGYSSLNLAAAVQLLAYELRTELLSEAGPVSTSLADKAGVREKGSEPISSDDFEGLIDALTQEMVAVEFLDPDNPRYLLRRIRKIFQRVELDRAELNIFRGFLSAVRRHRAASKVAADKAV